MTSDGESLGYQISLLARLLAQGLKRRNGAKGLLPGQYPIALALLHEERLSQKDLCARVRIEQGTMANTLKRMERDGLVTRSPAPEGGRLAHVRLSPRGRMLTEAAAENANHLNAVTVSGLGEADAAVLQSGLARMIENLEADLRRMDGAPATPEAPRFAQRH